MRRSLFGEREVDTSLLHKRIISALLIDLKGYDSGHICRSAPESLFDPTQYIFSKAPQAHDKEIEIVTKITA